MRYQVIFEIPGQEPIVKKTFSSKHAAEAYGLNVSKQTRAKHWKILVKATEQSRENTPKFQKDLRRGTIHRAKSLYNTLCDGDPTFKDRISLEDFCAGKLKELEQKNELE